MLRFGKMSRSPVIEARNTSHRPAKVLLIGFMAAYTVLHFILFITSAVAWGRAKARAQIVSWEIMGLDFSLNRWGLYPFMTFAALVCMIMSALMSFRAACRIKGSPLDTGFVFRGVFFTILILAPLVIFGWCSPIIGASPFPANTVFAEKSSGGNISSCADFPNRNTTAVPNIGSICGTFVLETRDVDFRAGKPALAMIHFNLAVGILTAGLAAAMAPAHCK